MMGEHKRVCLVEPVPCPYQNVGCSARPRRQDIPQHNLEAMGNHLQLAISFISQQRQEITRKDKEINHQNQQIAHKEDKIKQQRQEIAQKDKKISEQQYQKIKQEGEKEHHKKLTSKSSRLHNTTHTSVSSTTKRLFSQSKRNS